MTGNPAAGHATTRGLVVIDRQPAGVEVTTTAGPSCAGMSAAPRTTLYAQDMDMGLCIHEKTIVVEHDVAFVSSTDFSPTVPGDNRELAIATNRPTVTEPVKAAIEPGSGRS